MRVAGDPEFECANNLPHCSCNLGRCADLRKALAGDDREDVGNAVETVPGLQVPDVGAEIVRAYDNLADLLVDVAMDEWCVSKEYPEGTGSIEVVAHAASKEVAAVYHLLCVRAFEEDAEAPDDDAFARYGIERLLRGGYMPIVAYHGERPIGCAQVTLAVDPMTGERTAYLDEGYVVPEYRRQGVGKLILAASCWAAIFGGATHALANALIKDKNHMLEYYETCGWKKVSYAIEWRP